MSAAITITDLVKTYTREKPKKGEPAVTKALKGVSLTVEAGEFFALLGPNGAGKTTLISILCGLGKKTSGQVAVCGVSLDDDANTVKSFIGIVPQEMNFSIFERVIDIVLDQAGYYGIPRSVATPYAEQLLRDLGLWEKRNDKAETLSGGMKRRLMIARALVHKPQVLLLDEPTAGVDVELRRSMWDFLKRLNSEGTTILLTTHYLEEAEQLCKRVAIINHGEIIEVGSVKELLTRLHITTLLLDIREEITEAVMQLLRTHPFEREDDHTLKLTLGAGESANDAFRKISSIGLNILNVRTTGSRLEEVFMQIIERKS